MDDLLIDEVGQELDRSLAEQLVIPAVRFLELRDYSVDDESHHVGQLGVDCGEECRVDVSESRASHLSLDDGPGEEALSAQQVLVEELHDDVRDVGGVHFVDHAIDRLSQLLPHELLVSLTVLLLLSHLLKYGPHLEGWHIDATYRRNCLAFRFEFWSRFFNFFDPLFTCLG